MEVIVIYEYGFIVIACVHIVLCIALICFILLQSSEAQGLSGAIGGGAETFFGKNKGRTLDSKLRKITTFCAVLYVIVTLVLIVV
jgi:preprotein translocase subunit SecG